MIIRESYENMFGETLYKFIIGNGTYQPDIYYAYGYNEQEAFDVVVDNLEKKNVSNIYTIDEIEKEDIAEDEYIIGGNHGVALVHYGEFRIETPNDYKEATKAGILKPLDENIGKKENKMIVKEERSEAANISKNRRRKLPRWMEDDVGFDVPWDDEGFDIPEEEFEESLDEAREMHTWNITYTGKGNKARNHIVDAPDAYEANRKARRELGIAYTDIDDVTMVENKKSIKESAEADSNLLRYAADIVSDMYGEDFKNGLAQVTYNLLAEFDAYADDEASNFLADELYDENGNIKVDRYLEEFEDFITWNLRENDINEYDYD